MIRIAALSLSVAVLAACAQRDNTAEEIPVSFVCGAETITIMFAGESATLERRGETVALKQVVTASGAKYEKEGDPSTFFWNKGDGGLLSIDGVEYPECQSPMAQ